MLELIQIANICGVYHRLHFKHVIAADLHVTLNRLPILILLESVDNSYFLFNNTVISETYLTSTFCYYRTSGVYYATFTE